MVEVIKYGVIPDERIYQTECRSCGTQFRFKQAEASIKTDRGFSFLAIECPLCNRESWVSKRT